MMNESIWVLVWHSAYGDEGEGHEFIGWFHNQDDAVVAAATWDRPKGYGSLGHYDVHELRPLTLGDSNE